jgi:hypothetical protein
LPELHLSGGLALPSLGTTVTVQRMGLLD